ncbi:MAG: pyrroline-5-carboxylate reductase [Deltaproteobacteria bacterium]|nr:pyrroline-5-carboxylate reductase [Deltaproteobacteria bacterium]
MASVLLESFLKQKLIRPQEVLVSRRSAQALHAIKKHLKVHTTQDNQKLASSVEYLWLGIKPTQAAETLKNLGPSLSKHSLVLSMMAGVSIKSIQKLLSQPKISVIRLMPNTPTLLGQGMTGLYFPSNLSPKHQKTILKLLQATGEVYQAKQEKELDAVTALSGSGPAFIYYLAQALIEGGKQSGLSQKASQQLSYQTLQGAIAMLKQSQKNPEELIQQVVSPKGTTEAGLNYLKKHQVQKHLSQSIKAAHQRAQAIKRELESCLS